MVKIKDLFRTGDFRKDAKRFDKNDWFVGSFLNEGPGKTELLEIKYWEYQRKDKPKPRMKTSCTLECTLILRGKVRGTINGENVTLCDGEYAVIQPGVPNAIPQKVLSECVEGLTIKAPSIYVAKHEKVRRLFRVKTASRLNLDP